MLVRRRIRIDKERYGFVKTNPNLVGLLMNPDPGSVSGSWFLKKKKSIENVIVTLQIEHLIFFFLYHYQRLSSTPVLKSEHPTHQDMKCLHFYLLFVRPFRLFFSSRIRSHNTAEKLNY